MRVCSSIPAPELSRLVSGPLARPSPAWFCLRTHPKHEHIAAAHLEKEAAMEVCLPRIRYRRAKREGAAWVTEPMFPNYLFARFVLATSARRVQHAHGVAAIVHFGHYWPSIPDSFIQELRAQVGENQVQVIDDELRPGDEVVVCGGPLRNLRAVVTRVMPARQRVAVLLDFLGRQTEAELEGTAVLKPQFPG